MKLLQKLLRALVQFFRLPPSKPRAYIISRLPIGVEVSEDDRAAIYGKERAP